ncbi:MAG: metal ABC transporter permease [Trueperaceae bacterium]|nr:metal ABC transporter permease [Trueperaceae bacterium]MCO5173136.1 metal ABC transporter permease [Trueperaceae bacterium]MCW5818462.1 metal ABC transporter permease [Trueperaceae bacterium]
MLGELRDAFAFTFMQRALLAGSLIAVASGLLGTFVVQRRLAYLGDGLAHAAFGGTGVGAFVLVAAGQYGARSEFLRHPLLIALPAALATGLLITYVKRRTQLSSDTTIGVFLAVAVAVGLFFFTRIPVDTPLGFDIMDVLFGSILAVGRVDLIAIAAITALAGAVLARAWGKLAYATFDEELARSDGVNTARLEYLLVGTTAAVVAASSVVVGVVLMTAYLVIPAATARLGSLTLLGMTVKAVAIGVATTGAGLLGAFLFDAPTSSMLILMQAGVFGVVAVGRAVAGRT